MDLISDKGEDCRYSDPTYDEICPAADWWRKGITYAEATQENEDSSSVLEREFNERADRWERETAIHSSPSATYFHRDYIAIIASGMAHRSVIVPLILKRIPDSGSDWFFALENIAGQNPAEGEEDFAQAVEAWRNWAAQNC
jgi:hypothetical protein